MERLCKNCEFFECSQCRRYPPQIVFSTARDIEEREEHWPSVHKLWWCGEFKPSSAPASGVES